MALSRLSLHKHIRRLKDPRINRRKRHLLGDILTIAVCAVIAGANTWPDIETFGHKRLDWLQRFLELPNGIPAHDTFERLFDRLQPQALQTALLSWLHEISAVLVTVQRLLPQWRNRITLALWQLARREVKVRWPRRSVCSRGNLDGSSTLVSARPAASIPKAESHDNIVLSTASSLLRTNARAAFWPAFLLASTAKAVSRGWPASPDWTAIP
jgi:DDE_Tnp_1-associated